MRTLLQQIVENQDRAVACCRLVETRGSTPQKAGAMMLVFADGSQAGTLGGGCVEADVRRRAMAVIDGEPGEIATFVLDDDYGWDDGLICGGRMQVWIENVGHEPARRYYQTLRDTLDAGNAVIEAIVIDRDAFGGTPARACLFDASRRLLSDFDDSQNATTPIAVQKAISQHPKSPAPYATGGIAVIPYLPRRRLVIVGGGHVGKAVADLAVDLDFDVWVVDDREEFVSDHRFPRTQRRICGPVGEVLPELEITPQTYCLIVTRGHNHDEEALYHLVDRGAAYVGLIGSRRKIKLIFDDLEQEGVSPDVLARVRAPVGLDIGSQTVPEIAVSIAAELIAHRAGR